MDYQGTDGTDVITGTDDIDTINGNGGDDQLFGLGQEDFLYGGAGDDYLDGGEIRDVLTGGNGDDVYIVDLDGVYVPDGDGVAIGYYLPDSVREEAGAGIDEVRTSMSTYSLGEMNFIGPDGVSRRRAGGINVENLTGTSDAGQTLTGNELDNIITGAAGDDFLFGRGGVDTLVGGLGNDRYEVDEEDVIVEAADGGIDHVGMRMSSYTLPSHIENLTGLRRYGGQHLTGNELDNVITGTRGSERLEGLGGADTLVGGGGHDDYYADSADTLIEAVGGGTDRVRTYDSHILGANLENLALLGSAAANGYGNDLRNVIEGNGADNILYGYKGNDALRGGAGADELFGNDEDDSLRGEGGDDRLNGGNGMDFLEGGAGNDRLLGGADDDLVKDSDGDDVMRGDAGFDTVSYYGATAGVTVNLAITTAQTTGGAGTDILSGFERLIGSNFRNSLTGDAGANTILAADGNDRVEGGDGNDRLYGNDGIDTASYAGASAGVSVSLGLLLQNTRGAGVDRLESFENLIGSQFADRLEGNGEANRLEGGAGNDRLIGGPGDTLVGGAGNDIYFVGGGSLTFDERAGGGHDAVTSSADHVLAAFIEDLRLTTGGLTGTGNGLDNALTGSAGTDALYGLAGDDRVIGGGGHDSGFGGDGDDLLAGGDGDDSLEGGNDDDRLSGQAGADNLLGGDGSDRLIGAQDGDTLDGGAANDSVDGGAGIDILTGGAGADSFDFDDGDLGATRAGAERIADFSGYAGDRIDLRSIDADQGTAGDQNFHFIGESGFSGAAGELRFDVVDGNSFVQGDTDGDGAADFFLQLDGTPPLVAVDFVV
ncbi:MAG TPA: calcium-binding protein [Allosphingosinicella sp.]